MSCIKSIQRGVDRGDKTITIGAVDAAKAIVLVSGGTTYYSDSTFLLAGSNPIIMLINSTTIQISNAEWYKKNGLGNRETIDLPYAWQVIEFN